MIGTILNSFTVVDHFMASGNNIGINLVGNHTSGGELAIVDSVMAQNASDGLLNGMAGFSTPTSRLAGSVAIGNGVGVLNAEGTVFSYGDNEIDSVQGTLTPLAKK
ncbi:MAG: hypothetical protein WA624_22520 [Methylocella sp.]